MINQLFKDNIYYAGLWDSNWDWDPWDHFSGLGLQKVVIHKNFILITKKVQLHLQTSRSFSLLSQNGIDAFYILLTQSFYYLCAELTEQNQKDQNWSVNCSFTKKIFKTINDGIVKHYYYKTFAALNWKENWEKRGFYLGLIGPEMF